jgi:lipoprotein-anchoring transpeptidase ErfK/SrfK
MWSGVRIDRAFCTLFNDPMISIRIHIPDQRLELLENDQVLQRYTISSAANGAGEEQGSGCTPRGRHRICSKIGGDAPLNAVFVGREPTGEVYSPELAANNPDRDWVLTRILWLDGQEPGRNRGGERDSRERYIYIHGTPDTEPMGEPHSHGCVRMRNDDLLELFERVEEGTLVDIIE